LRFELLKILLVDDNHHMRVLLTEILRAIGVRDVFEATDGAEALKSLRVNQIDIIMTDLAMQPLDGIDFVRLLRNSPDSPNPMAPVIMIAGCRRRETSASTRSSPSQSPRAACSAASRRWWTIRGLTSAPMAISAPTAAAAPTPTIPAPAAAPPTTSRSRARRPKEVQPGFRAPV